jgi:hypothetical protein
LNETYSVKVGGITTASDVDAISSDGIRLDMQGLANISQEVSYVSSGELHIQKKGRDED